LKPAFATITVITIMINSESNIKSFFESFSAPDSEPNKEYDSKPDLEIKDTLLVSLKPRDNVSFSLSQLFTSVPPPSSISKPSQSSVSTFYELSESSS